MDFLWQSWEARIDQPNKPDSEYRLASGGIAVDQSAVEDGRWFHGGARSQSANRFNGAIAHFGDRGAKRCELLSLMRFNNSVKSCDLKASGHINA